MTPDPDATPAPPEPASAPPPLPEKDLRAVETAIAGAAALLIGRVLLGRAGGLAAGLAALGAGLLGKRPPPAPAREETPDPASNGHALLPATSAPVSPFIQVRQQTSPVPPVDAVAALTAATAWTPVSLPEAPPAAVEHLEREKAVEPEAVVVPVIEVSEPPAAAEAVREPVDTAGAPLQYSALDAAIAEDAGAFAEMPALFGPVKEPTAPVPLPLAAILEQTAQDLAAAPVPLTAPVPSSKTTPVPGLLDDLPLQFMELKEEQDPGPRDGFLLIPEESSRSLPSLEPVVAALRAEPPELPDPNQREFDLLAWPEFPAPPPAATAPVPPLPEAMTEAPAAAAVSAAAELSGELPEPAIAAETTPAAAAETPPWSTLIFPAAEADAASAPKTITAPVADLPAAPVLTPSTAPLPLLPALPTAATAPVAPLPEAMAETPATAELSNELPGPAIAAETTPAADAETPPWSTLIFPATEADAASVPKAITAPVAHMPAAPVLTLSTAPVPLLPALPTAATAPVAPLPEAIAEAPAAAAVSAAAELSGELPEPAIAAETAPTAAAETPPWSTLIFPAAEADASFAPKAITAPVADLPAAPAPTPSTAPVPLLPALPPLPPILTPAAEQEPPAPATPPVPPRAVSPTAPVRPIPLPRTATAPVAEMPALPPLTQLPAAATAPVPPVKTNAVLPPVSPSPEPEAQVVDSPFRIWQAAAPPALSGPPADPDNIWRQAAAELAAVRAAPTASPVPLAFPPSVPAPGAVLPAPYPILFPPATASQATRDKVQLPSGSAPSLPDTPDSPLPPWHSQVPVALSADTPPWLKNTTASPLPKTEAKPFLPTTLLGTTLGPQPLASRRPFPISEAVPPAPDALPAFRTEAVSPILPDDSTADPVLDLDTPLPDPVPTLPAAISPATAPTLPAAPTSAPAPIFPAAAQPAADKAKRGRTSRATLPVPIKHRRISPIAVIASALASALALALAFKPQLIKIWDEQILRKLPPDSAPISPRPASPALPDNPPRVPGDGSDVIIAPDPPKPPPPSPAPAPSPAPVPETAPPAALEPTPESSVIDTEPLPAPPPPTSDNPDAPITVSEAGAKELINRLIYATSAQRVKPLILDAAKLAPTIEAYFRDATHVPVATHHAELERNDKIPGTTRSQWLFRVTTDTVTGGFPVLIEETPGGLRADWELFRQCRDMALQKFLADKSAAPGIYYTGLQRRHIFPDMLPGEDHTQFLAFAVASPILGAPASFAYIPNSSSLAARAEALFKFGGLPYAPVLELAHKNGRVEITGIIRENWRAPAKK